jgi:HSP20 family molecular chaperone IbpA
MYTSLIDDMFFGSRNDYYANLLPQPKESKAYSICESENEVVLQLEIPGVKRQKVSVTVQKKCLEIVAVRDNDTPRKYRFTIDESYDVSSPDAKLEDGILTVKFPRKKGSDRIIVQVK